MPPGTEYGGEARTPDAVLWFRVYAGVNAAIYTIVVLFSLVLMFAPLWVPKSASAPGSELGFFIMGLFYGGFGLVFLAPSCVALFAGRRPWVHGLGTVVIVMGMLHLCCIPLMVPLLLVWLKPETRAWYGAR
jgi:hypothetical protein